MDYLEPTGATYSTYTYILVQRIILYYTACHSVDYIVAWRKITLTTCTAPCIYLVVILCFQFFFSPFVLTHDLPRGIILLYIIIIVMHTYYTTRDCLHRVSVIIYIMCLRSPRPSRCLLRNNDDFERS